MKRYVPAMAMLALAISGIASADGVGQNPGNSSYGSTRSAGDSDTPHPPRHILRPCRLPSGELVTCVYDMPRHYDATPLTAPPLNLPKGNQAGTAPSATNPMGAGR